MGHIVVINPNSTEAVTEGMREAVADLCHAPGPTVECVTLEEGPPGIQTQTDIDQVVGPIRALVGRRQADADAFVIACYSDPGLTEAREVSAVPVLGIAESAMRAALDRGERFGVISILEGSIPRHLRYVRALGLDHHCAGDRAIGLGVAELAEDPDRTYRRMLEVALALRDQDGANVLILGCAGMAPHRRRLEDATGLPVVEPTRAAVEKALGAVHAGRQ